VIVDHLDDDIDWYLMTDEAPGFSPLDRIVKVITSSRMAGLSDFAV